MLVAPGDKYLVAPWDTHTRSFSQVFCWDKVRHEITSVPVFHLQNSLADKAILNLIMAVLSLYVNLSGISFCYSFFFCFCNLKKNAQTKAELRVYDASWFKNKVHQGREVRQQELEGAAGIIFITRKQAVEREEMGQGGVHVSVPATRFIERAQDPVLGWCQPHWMGPQRKAHASKNAQTPISQASLEFI